MATTILTSVLDRSPAPVFCPFTVLIDQREQAPFCFADLPAGSQYKGRPLVVPTETALIATGDYSIRHFHHLVVIERKSVADLWGSLGTGRERFESEHQRMQQIVQAGGYAAVVIEGNWGMIARQKPQQSRLHYNSLYGTACHWSIRYGVHWWAENGRRDAELRTYRLLEAFWVQWQKKQEEAGKGEFS